MPALLKVLLYGLFFIVLSEHLTWESIVAAGFAIALTQWFLVTPQGNAAPQWRTIPALILLWFQFVAILIREILLANLQVARIVLSIKPNIAPQLNHYTTQLKKPSLLTVFSTAITLTPGTMTVDIQDSTLLIHCLTQGYAQSLDKNPVEPILLRIEEVLNG